MEPDNMIREIIKYPNGTYLKIEWENSQLVLEGKIGTIYETDNGLDEEDAGYIEFYACALSIEKIVKNTRNKNCHIGSLIEISIENPPVTITLEDGSIIWQDDSSK